MRRKAKIYSNEIFARNFEALMFAKGLTLREISEITSLPVSSISTWKRGRVPRAAAARRMLEKVFGVPLEEMSRGELSPREIIFSNDASPSAAQKCVALIRAHVDALVAERPTAAQARGLLRALRAAFPLGKDIGKP